MDDEGKLIELDAFRQRQQRALKRNGLKEKVLKRGAVLVLSGISAGFLFLAGYGTYKLFSSEPVPRAVHHDASTDYQPAQIEKVFLPPNVELIHYTPEQTQREGVVINYSGYRISYIDTDGDHTVDQIIIDDTTSSGFSPLEKKVEIMPIGSVHFKYGTELLRGERERYFREH
ncbi:hypothetical protein HYT55_03150 [Candidatus Woesearchaeota archaeon]|nr:hypothetical protein [Candidatus Woesearchaeota archaeon]